MRISLLRDRKRSVDVKRCALRLLLTGRAVADKKVFNGRSQWFSHVR